MEEREEKGYEGRSLEEQRDGGRTPFPEGKGVAAGRDVSVFGGGVRKYHYTAPYTPKQRILLLDTMIRSGLPATEFADLVGLSTQTLYEWRRRFKQDGPQGLSEKRRPTEGSRLPEVTKRAILMMKQMHPEWGCERISLMLGRGPGLGASPNAVQRVLREAGYEVEQSQVPVHRDQPRRFERARPNQLWQTDIFTFMLKRQNRRVYLVAFLDDNSRFIVGYGLHASMSTALVIETFRAAVSAYGAPEEVLSDQGPQYYAWRGTSRFSKELQKHGVKHLVAHARHPQTVGKAERFWGTLWRECVSAAVFLDLEDARRRIGFFIDHYNFQRVHSGIDGLVPADRFFEAAPEVHKTLRARVMENALSLAQQGSPRKPFYLTGRVGGVDLSIHAEGERVVLSTTDGKREEVDLRATGRREQKAAEGEEQPEPVAVQGRVSDAALKEEMQEDFDEQEEKNDGRYSEDRREETGFAGGLEEQAAGTYQGQSGSEAGRDNDSGSVERDARAAGGERTDGRLINALLRPGEPGASGNGQQPGAETQGPPSAKPGGCRDEGGAGVRQAEAGAFKDPGPAEARAQELQHQGTPSGAEIERQDKTQIAEAFEEAARETDGWKAAD